MKDHMIEKLENPRRINLLQPEETLKRAGFQSNMTLCDIGAGTGIFSFPAARLSTETVYALEQSDKMIKSLEEKLRQENTGNLVVRKVTSSRLPIETGSCDMVIMVTVLHELEDPQTTAAEIRRIIKDSGRILLIDFHKKETPQGPPVSTRISEDKALKIFTADSFVPIDRFDLGEDFYALVMEVSSETEGAGYNG